MEVGKGFEPQDLVVKDAAKVSGGSVNGIFHDRRGMDGATGDGFKIDAGDGAVADAARHDELEVAQVGGDIKSEPVGSNAARDVDADGGDFFLGDCAGGKGPDAGASGNALGGNAKVRAGADEGFFEEADVVDGSKSRGKATEIEDGIADELAGTMIGDVASAVDFVDCDAAAGKDLV